MLKADHVSGEHTETDAPHLLLNQFQFVGANAVARLIPIKPMNSVVDEVVVERQGEQPGCPRACTLQILSQAEFVALLRL